MNVDIQIFTPPVAETPLDDMLVEITKAIAGRDAELVSHGCLGGEFGYGARWDSPVFQMHPYCWCEADDCPWCCGCHCGDNSWVDNPTTEPGVQCAWCRSEHRFAEQGALHPDEWPHYGAPHFWHKPTGLKVWWYKWIGRDMQVLGPAENLTPILAECLADIASRDSDSGPKGEDAAGG